MRKIALVIALIAMASMAFALDIAVSGNATLTAGYNLNCGDFGLSSGTGTDVDLVIAEGSKSSSSTQEWYGEISITGAKFWIGDKDGDDDGSIDGGETVKNNLLNDMLVQEDDSLQYSAPEVKAKITNGTYYVIIAAKPGFKIGQNTPIEDGDDSEDADEGNTGAFTVGGTLMEGLVAEVSAGTETDWTDYVTADDYSFSGKVAYTAIAAANVSVLGAVEVQNAAYANSVISAKVNGTIDIITYTVAGDVVLVNGSDAEYDFGADVAVAIGGLKVTAAASLASATGSTDFNGLDAKAGVAYKEGAIDASVAVKMVDVALIPAAALWNPGVLLNVAGSYVVSDAIKVGFTTDVDKHKVDFGVVDQYQVKASAYAEMKLLDNTQFTLKWEAKDLTAVNGAELNNIGFITLETKISI